MPIFFQQQINPSTRLGVWKIEETEEFFKDNVPQHRDVTHPHKRLQHLAGRFLLRYLFPDFPYELIRIADTRKPFLPDAQYHFSISHCGDYAAALVSRDFRTGVDAEIPVARIERIASKFTTAEEQSIFDIAGDNPDVRELTTIWSIKEAVYKWYGDGEVDFRAHIRLLERDAATQQVRCLFTKNNTTLDLHYRHFDHLVLAWVVS